MAINSAALGNLTSNFINTYEPKSISTGKFDAHKKNELRNLYGSIVKMNRDTPLFLLETGKDTQEFAVNLKENAREFKNTIASYAGLGGASILDCKTAYSTNNSIASAKYIGSDSTEPESIPSFELGVTKLAKSQQNVGFFLPDTEVALETGTYSFDIAVKNLNYEFQFNINSSDTNRDVQDRLSRLINSSDIGLESRVIDDPISGSALSISSASTGITDRTEIFFRISDDKTSKQQGSVSYLGIDKITQMPSNAEFTLNHEVRTSASNNFTVAKTYEIELKNVGENSEDTTTIGVKADLDSLDQNMKQFITGYNQFLRSINEFSDNHPKTRQLVNEMKGLSGMFNYDLNSVGITLQADGTLDFDAEQLNATAVSKDAKELFTGVQDYAQSLVRKAGQVAINPMNYAERTIVAYKNPGKNFTTPYITSEYSGMMFNSYC